MVDSFKRDYNEPVQEERNSAPAIDEISKKIDIHVHLLGDEKDGCYIAPSLLRKTWLRIIASRLGIKTPAEYAKKLAEYITDSPIDAGVVLAMDYIFDEQGQQDPRTSIFVPNSFVFKVTSEYPRLLPGVSIHPNRRDALEQIDLCAELGAVLVKWIPNAQGIDPSNKRYSAFYRKLADYGLPLLSHTGYEFTLPVIDQALGNPEKLRRPLEEGVTVIAGHSGISYSGFSTRYLKIWLDLIKKYPNLYGDIAASSIGIGGHYINKLLMDKEVCDRLVNGSDFPVPPLRTLSDVLGKHNPFTRDFNIKCGLGVPESVFHRGYTLLRTKEKSRR